MKGCAICRWFAQLLPLIPFRFSHLISSFFCYCVCHLVLLSHCICSSIFDMFFFFIFFFNFFSLSIPNVSKGNCINMVSFLLALLSNGFGFDIDRRIANGCTNVRICKCAFCCLLKKKTKCECMYLHAKYIYKYISTIFSLYGCSDNRNGFKVLLLWCFLCSFHLLRLYFLAVHLTKGRFL